MELKIFLTGNAVKWVHLIQWNKANASSKIKYFRNHFLLNTIQDKQICSERKQLYFLFPGEYLAYLFSSWYLPSHGSVCHDVKLHTWSSKHRSCSSKLIGKLNLYADNQLQRDFASVNIIVWSGLKFFSPSCKT